MFTGNIESFWGIDRWKTDIEPEERPSGSYVGCEDVDTLIRKYRADFPSTGGQKRK